MRIERTEDVALIKSIVTHPSVWNAVSDDGVNQSEYEPIIHPTVDYLAVMEGNVVHGCYMLHPHNCAMYEIHTCILPSAYGEKARVAAKLLLEWVFRHTTCLKLITHVPENNPLALRYAKRAGMVQEGINRKSFLKNGQLLDQILLGITKEEFICQQQQW